MERGTDASPRQAVDEVAEISDRIREALECPVCMELKTDMRCYCPNAHPVCRACVSQMRALGGGATCPMCRSQLSRNANGRTTAARVMAVLPMLRVACRYRAHGCGLVAGVADTLAHEPRCPRLPDVRCLVAGCHWLGTRDRLYAHVGDRHPEAVACTAGDRLVVDDADRITSAGRRAYLVRTDRGDRLLWVLMSRESRGRIKAGVFAVQSRQRPAARLEDNDGGEENGGENGGENGEENGEENGRENGDDDDDDLMFRVTFPRSDRTGRRRYVRNSTRVVGRWHSSLDGPDDRVDDKAASYTKFTCRDERLEIRWFGRAGTVHRTRSRSRVRSAPPADDDTSASETASARDGGGGGGGSAETDADVDVPIAV